MPKLHVYREILSMAEINKWNLDLHKNLLKLKN